MFQYCNIVNVALLISEIFLASDGAKSQLTLHDITTSESATSPSTLSDFVSWCCPEGEIAQLFKTQSSLH